MWLKPLLGEFPFIFAEDFSWAIIGNWVRGSEVNHPTDCWKPGWVDLSLKGNHNGADKSRSWINYRFLYLKGGRALQKEGDNNYVCSTSAVYI